MVPRRSLLEAAAQSGFDSTALFLAFHDALSGRSQHPLMFVPLAQISMLRLFRTLWVELVSAGEGGLVDPVSAKGLCEHVGRCLVVLGDYEGVVGFPAPGHGRVDTSTVGRCVDKEDGGVDGAALAGMAGLRIAQFEVTGDVLGGQSDGASAASESIGAK